MQNSQTSQTRDILSLLTSNRQESLLQAFLIGAAYVRHKMNTQVLTTFTQGVEQLVSLSLSMGRQDIIQELYDTLLQGKEQSPIKYIEQLTDRLFSNNQMMMKGNSEMNEDEQLGKMIEEEQRQENERNERLAREVAQRMDDEDMKKHKEQRQQENIQMEGWNCEICLEQMTDQQFWPLECKHQFHRDCLSQYFNVKIKDRNFPLKCPNDHCKREVDYVDLKEILTKTEFQKYEEFQLNTYIENNLDEISWCPSAGCKYAFVLEENQTQLICPLCRKRFCLTCKCEYHKNQTCKEYQISHTFSVLYKFYSQNEDDKHFDQFVRGQKFKQCLNCKMWVERNQGCDHMTCRCGCQFCYKCGGPYLRCECHGH